MKNLAFRILSHIERAVVGAGFHRTSPVLVCRPPIAGGDSFFFRHRPAS
jgi:hypothetical protein